MQSQLFTPAGQPHPDVPRSGATSKGTGRLRRLAGLIRKESFQILRDPSSFLIAGVLPLLLLFIFGFGVSLDLKRVPIGVVVEWPSPESDSFLASFRNSRYFEVHLRGTEGHSSPSWYRGGSKGSSYWRLTSATGSAAAIRLRSR